MTTPATRASSGGLAGRDTAFASGVVLILAILFLPVPTALIDLGLAVSIALSVLILMVALWIDRPLDFSSFPTILLIATMLRLSLNVATTRVILSEGHTGESAAGHVIGGFASLVMNGDFLIGVVVFLILVTVNFVVITKGAGRIAEVSARFTLDGIPGKQMAIDADVSAGTIDEETARLRRNELEEETSFFGAMDGASKFVRGDAVAGLLITAVNMIGGIVIGATRHSMGFSEAADAFVRLSVGDGLVSQIPALIVSLAAGLVVSKGGTRGSAERAVLDQVAAHPRALALASALMVLLAVLPGLPFLPFAVLAAILAGTGLAIARRAPVETADTAGKKDAEAEGEAASPDPVAEALHAPPIEIAAGAVASVVTTTRREELSHRMGRLRRRFAARYGVVVPDVALRTDVAMPERGYVIRLHGTAIARGETGPDEVLVVRRPGAPEIEGEPAREPAFGMPAVRLPASRAEALRAGGERPIDAVSVILTHLAEVLRVELDRLLTHRDLRGLVDRLDPATRKLAETVGESALGWTGLQSILRALLVEGVSIRDLGRILEAVAELPPATRRETMVEHVRSVLARQICADLAGDGPLRIVRLGDVWEDMLARALRRDAHGNVLAFDASPDLLRRFGEALRERLPRNGPDPRATLVTSPELRPYVRMILERLDPDLTVLAHTEIPHAITIEIEGELPGGEPPAPPAARAPAFEPLPA